METRRPVSSEDLFHIKAITDPQISPDGSRIAYVQTVMDPNTNKYNTRIWMVPTTGLSEPQQFTSGPGLDYAPRWSPDGKFMAFISTRSGTHQLWTIASTGGQAHLLSDLQNVSGSPAWSPDGTNIACIVRVHSDAPEERDELDKIARKRFSKDVLLIDRLPYKLDSVGFLVNENWHLFSIKAIGPERGKFHQLTFGAHNYSSPAWSPDGQFIAVASNVIPAMSEADVVNDIWVVPSMGGKPRRLTRSTGPADYPSWSPDGRNIAFIGHDRRSGYYTNRGIWIVPFDGGEPWELTCNFKYPVGDYSLKDFPGYAQPSVNPYWSADGRKIYMNISAHGAVHLWRFSVPDGSAVQLTDGALVIYNLSFSSSRGQVAMAVTAPTLPNDIWIGGFYEEVVKVSRLTRVNQDWDNQVTLVQPTRFTFHSNDGPEAEGWILFPPKFPQTEKTPTILQIHGGPSRMYGYVFMFEFQMLATNGFAVIYTNPRGSMGYGQAFSDAISGDWGNLDYADLMAAVDIALLQGPLDPERLGVAGGSYGGYMTNWIVTQNNRFKAAVSMRSISNLYSFFGTSDGGLLHADELDGPPWEYVNRYLKRSPISYVANVETPILLIHSDRDFRVPIEQGEQFYTALKYLQRKVKMVRFLTETHELSRHGEPWHRVIRLDHILDWFQQHLKREKGDDC